MTKQNSSRVFVFFLLVLAKVAPWTIDLPEVRKQLFEEHDKLKKYTEFKNYINDGRAFYSNIQGNSKHNSDERKISNQYNDQYANAFGHQSYMEKKVSDIVHDGGIYLEGLRRALEDYSRFLEECRRPNASMIPSATPTQSNMSMILDLSNPQNFNVSEPPIMTGDDSAGTRRATMRMTCKEATEASEKVRRYADLAMWATKRLQDLAYASEYQKTDQYEENELLLKLAWFLDQLALLTGFEPNYSQYVTERSTTTSTTSPAPLTMVPQTQELNNFLMNCIKTNSPIPATDRCRYPLPLPDMIAQAVGATSTPSPQLDGGDVVPLSQIDSTQQPMELLIAADDFRTPRRITKRSPDEYYVPIPVHEKPKPVVDFIVKKLSNLKAIVKSVKKNAVADFTSQLAHHKHFHKRAIDDDTTVLLNRVSNDLTTKSFAESNDSNDQQSEHVAKVDDSVDKSDQPIVTSDELTAKPDELIVKSDDSILKSDESIVNVDKSTIKVLSLQQFPVLDASVVNTKSFKKRSIRDSGKSYNLLNILPYQKIPVKGSVKSVKKRAVDDPLSKLTSYYLKHKVWDNSNPALEQSKKSSTNFEVNNSLQSKIIAKRSLINKQNIHFIFLQPFQLPNLNKHKNSGKKGKSKLLYYLSNMLEKKNKKLQKNTHKISKRSIKYEHMYLPRIPMNPVGDISYYVKNKPGRRYNPSLTQAAQVRWGLQQAFATGNILVIQRFGSNYNPAVPDAFVAGMMKGLADS